MNGCCLKGSSHFFSFLQRQLFQRMMRHIGHKRETAIKLDFLIRSQRSNLLDLSRERHSGRLSFLSKRSSKGSRFPAGCRGEPSPLMGTCPTASISLPEIEATKVGAVLFLHLSCEYRLHSDEGSNELIHGVVHHRFRRTHLNHLPIFHHGDSI